jgi:hypothetical protein
MLLDMSIIGGIQVVKLSMVWSLCPTINTCHHTFRCNKHTIFVSMQIWFGKLGGGVPHIHFPVHNILFHVFQFILESVLWEDDYLISSNK